MDGWMDGEVLINVLTDSYLFDLTRLEFRGFLWVAGPPNFDDSIEDRPLLALGSALGALSGGSRGSSTLRTSFRDASGASEASPGAFWSGSEAISARFQSPCGLD